jgi:hypothetical protein
VPLPLLSSGFRQSRPVRRSHDRSECVAKPDGRKMSAVRSEP